MFAYYFVFPPPCVLELRWRIKTTLLEIAEQQDRRHLTSYSRQIHLPKSPFLSLDYFVWEKYTSLLFPLYIPIVFWGSLLQWFILYLKQTCEEGDRFSMWKGRIFPYHFFLKHEKMRLKWTNNICCTCFLVCYLLCLFLVVLCIEIACFNIDYIRIFRNKDWLYFIYYILCLYVYAYRLILQSHWIYYF